jgi:hypothetical protein
MFFSSQTNPGAHRASYPIGTRSKAPGP